jgi:hypothetical protein
MGVRDITGKSSESEVWALRQDDGSLETLQPFIRLLGLQFDKQSRLGLDICQSTFCRDFSTSELFLLISLVYHRNEAVLTEHPASSWDSLSWSWSYWVLPSPDMADTRGQE